MRKMKRLEYATLELGGVAYAVMPEAQLLALCKQARVEAIVQRPAVTEGMGAVDEQGRTLAQRIRQRRRAAGLTQVRLASTAGIRTETLNRIERGHTEPDFRTVRKLVVALKRLEEKR